MKKILGASLLVVFLVFSVTAVTAQTVNDVTAQLEDLGIPSKKAGYAKNIWDLVVFNNKIYIGTGNSSNSAPNSNAGPIPIISLNPATKQFTEEPITLQDGTVKTAVDDEQIEVFRVLDGMLAIPGHDSRESWSLGNFYVLKADGWKKYRTVPSGIHVYDLAAHGGKWFAALGADGTKSVAVFSSDQGQTWTGSTTLQSKPDLGEYHTRIYRYYEIGGELYTNDFRGIYKFDGSDFVQLDPQIYMNMLPNYAGATRPQAIQGVPVGFPYASRLERGITFSNHFVYIGADGINDHQWLPMGLYKSSQIGSATKITVPNNPTVWDTLVRGSTLYVLGSIKTDATHYTVTVSQTTDLNTWTEVARFSTDTFARSFEEKDGYFYFGLGSDTTTIPADTGKLLRVKLTTTPSPVVTPTPAACPTDINNDRVTNLVDYSLLVQNFLKSPLSNPRADITGDGKVDLLDYSRLVAAFLKAC